MQPVGGFSALLDAPGFATYWAMPDNGFGTKANSHSFLLRVYKVHADFETAHGGPGTVRILQAVTLRDPDHRIPFKLVNDATPDRLLTGGDFDIESVRKDYRGDAVVRRGVRPLPPAHRRHGKVLEAPIPLPDVKSPDYPPDYPSPVAGAANLASSNGFEGMAISPDGRTLYPTLEGPVAGDDQLTRRMYQFDIAKRRYASTRRHLPHGRPDLPALRPHRAGRPSPRRPGARRHHGGHDRAQAGLRHRPAQDRAGGGTGQAPGRRPEHLRDPALISLPARPGDLGLGDPFAMPYVTIEAILPLRGDRAAIVNDTNFGSTGRNPGLPDYSDFIVISVPGLRDGRHW